MINLKQLQTPIIRELKAVGRSGESFTYEQLFEKDVMLIMPRAWSNFITKLNFYHLSAFMANVFCKTDKHISQQVYVGSKRQTYLLSV